jgi:hypothetical protein
MLTCTRARTPRLSPGSHSTKELKFKVDPKGRPSLQSTIARNKQNDFVGSNTMIVPGQQTHSSLSDPHHSTIQKSNRRPGHRHPSSRRVSCRVIPDPFFLSLDDFTNDVVPLRSEGWSRSGWDRWSAWLAWCALARDANCVGRTVLT